MSSALERESKILRSTIVRLRRLGIMLFRRNVAVQRAEYKGKTRVFRCGAKGQSDLYGWEIATGRHWEIEVKRPGNRPTELQLDWLKECQRLGAVAYWGDNANIIERVAEAILQGGRIEWLDGDEFDVEFIC